MIKTGGTLLLGIAIGVVGVLFLRSEEPQVGGGSTAQVVADNSSSERRAASENEALRQRVADLEDQIADLQDSQEVAEPPVSPREPLVASTQPSSGRRIPSRNVGSVPAIPDFPDFEIDLQTIGTYEDGLTIPELLAAEPRDEQWASGTESLLLSEALGATAAPITTVQTECRTTWCGVVIEVPESIPVDDVRAMYLELMQSVGTDETVSRDYTFGRPNAPGGHIVFYYRADR